MPKPSVPGVERRTSVDELVGLEGGGEKAEEEPGCRERPLSADAPGHEVGVEGKGHRPPVALGVGVAEAPHHRAEVSDEGVGDLGGCSGDYRVPSADHGGALERPVPDQGTDAQALGTLLHAVESWEPVDVDQEGGVGEAELHQRDQALTPGQDLRLVTVPGEEVAGFLSSRWARVRESRRVHRTNPRPGKTQ